MMAAARIPADADPALEQEIADLWADGFDSVDITDELKREGHAITEAQVCQILQRQQTWRFVDKAGEGAN